LSLPRLGIVLIAIGACVAARADDFYRGKTINIVVGASPSGSFDVTARILARRLGAYIPGNPGVVVQNMTGAASVTALRYIEATAPRDGTAIGVFLPGVLTQSLVTPSKVNVDLGGLSWVGVISADYSRVCYGYGSKGVSTWGELMRRPADAPFIMGSTGPGASNYINGKSLHEVLGAPLKIILGFPGSSELRMAAERGELDGDCGGVAGIPPDWLRDGLAKPFVRFAESLAPGVPKSAVYVGDLAKTDEQKSLLKFLYAADKLGRPYVVSKLTPPERLELLRNAFAATMNDVAFLADMERANEAVAPVTGLKAEAIFAAMQNAPKSIVDAARKIYE